ncbi:hypothetical protein OG884_26710 [Streptosporangium sp. NBC_01755]|uniref:hypothetical protein n=1 Tax=Streptosporangium sp. NBC_01755 TaxID=2975949 RepID=UPI002DD9507B|nr:hypothetical protein [Streptosporangium sp. NBC_01755]WSC98442.1 hypothetical protein OG884_26710 [Streptosporangium sp. NBC_01755]
MAADPRIVSAQRRIAVDRSWAMTPDRSERTAAARAASPTSLDHWITKIRAEGKVREKDIQKNAESAHRAYMRGMSLRAAAAKRVKKEIREAERLKRMRRSA